jgi:hypothetical protein
MVHEVDLSVGSLRHLPAGRQVICDVIALLTQVLQLVALKSGEKNYKNLRNKLFKADFCSVADTDPGSGAILTPGTGMGIKSGSGSRSGMKNTDHISESLETIFWVEII